MPPRFSIPVYSRLSPRARQNVHLIGGGLAMALLALVVSGMLGGTEIKPAAAPELPKARPVSGVPGAQLSPQDAWMGGAGKEIAQLREQIKTNTDALTAMRGDHKQVTDRMDTEIKTLRERGFLPPGPPLTTSAPAPIESGAPAPSGAVPGTGALPTASPAVMPPAVRPAMTFPMQRSGPQGANAPAAPGAYPTYPPGVPNAGAAGYAPGGQQGAEFVPPPAPVLLRVSSESGSAQASEDGGRRPGAEGHSAKAAAPRTLASFLPVGFTRAVLLGGLAAPTGGQAQSNPVPVLLRLADLAVLPNGFRAQVKDCLVIGEGFGDHSAERAYIRATLLSCVMRDGQVLEVPIKGSVFGEDGMNGMNGKLITKQGAILGNALLAGVASGIGSGIAQATQTVSSTSLGQVSANPTDASGILKQGFGTGVGKALDRLAQYYINLAERTFPVIEIQPGRYVDVVIQQGVSLDVALASVAPAQGIKPARGGAADNDRSALMRSVRSDSED